MARVQEGGEVNLTRTAVGGSYGDAGKWLALVSALIGLGMLPSGWRKPVAAAGAVIAIIKILE